MDAFAIRSSFVEKKNSLDGIVRGLGPHACIRLTFRRFLHFRRRIFRYRFRRSIWNRRYSRDVSEKKKKKQSEIATDRYADPGAGPLRVRQSTAENAAFSAIL